MKSDRTWLNPISLTSSLLQLLALLLPVMRFIASPSPPSPTRLQPESQSKSWASPGSLLPAFPWKGAGTNSTLPSKCFCNHRNISHEINTEKPEFPQETLLKLFPDTQSCQQQVFTFEKNDTLWSPTLLFGVLKLSQQLQGTCEP